MPKTGSVKCAFIKYEKLLYIDLRILNTQALFALNCAFSNCVVNAFFSHLGIDIDIWADLLRLWECGYSIFVCFFPWVKIIFFKLIFQLIHERSVE